MAFMYVFIFGTCFHGQSWICVLQSCLSANWTWSDSLTHMLCSLHLHIIDLFHLQHLRQTGVDV